MFEFWQNCRYFSIHAVLFAGHCCWLQLIFAFVTNKPRLFLELLLSFKDAHWSSGILFLRKICDISDLKCHPSSCLASLHNLNTRGVMKISQQYNISVIRPWYNIYCHIFWKDKQRLEKCSWHFLVLVWQCLLICLSVTFFPFSSLDTGKPKCFETSGLKLVGASAVSNFTVTQFLLGTCCTSPSVYYPLSVLLDLFSQTHCVCKAVTEVLPWYGNVMPTAVDIEPGHLLPTFLSVTPKMSSVFLFFHLPLCTSFSSITLPTFFLPFPHTSISLYFLPHYPSFPFAALSRPPFVWSLSSTTVTTETITDN